MFQKNGRPLDLGIFHATLPIGALVSILHRVTGVALVFLFPVAFYLAEWSLRSPADYAEVTRLLAHPLARIALLIAVGLFAQHFFAGIRHLLLDIDIGISRRSGRIGAYAVLIATGLTLAVTAAALL